MLTELIILFIIFYLTLCFYRLEWAVMLLIFALPGYLIRFKIFGLLPSTILEMMILISFFVWLWQGTELKNYLFKKDRIKRFKENKAKREPYPFGLEAVLLLIVSFVAVTVAKFDLGSLGIWRAYFFEPLLVFILVLNLFKKDIAKILWPLLFSALAVSALAIYQKFTGAFIPNPLWAAEATRRVTSFFGYPNAVGLYLGPLVVFFISWLSSIILSFSGERQLDPGIQGKLKRRLDSGSEAGMTIKIVFIIFTIIASLLAIYFARSRGAMLGIGAALIVMGLIYDKKLRYTIIILLIAAGLGVAAYQPARHLAYKYLTLNDFSGQVRKQQWKETWQMLSDGRILSGAGLDKFQSVVSPYHQAGIWIKNIDDPDWLRKVLFNEEFRKKAWQPVEIYMYPHNIILNFWSELGLAGLLLFIWIFFKYFKLGYLSLRGAIATRQSQKFVIMGLIGAMVAIIIHGLVDVPYFKNDLSIMFWLFIAMMSLINLQIKEKI